MLSANASKIRDNAKFQYLFGKGHSRSVENMSYNSRDITLIIRDTVPISCTRNEQQCVCIQLPNMLVHALIIYRRKKVAFRPACRLRNTFRHIQRKKLRYLDIYSRKITLWTFLVVIISHYNNVISLAFLRFF